MPMLLSTSDRFGFLHPSVDVHTLGINSIEQLLAECGIMARRASPEINEAANRAADPASARALRDWIKGNGITAIGFSYRLDPEDGLRLFSAFVDALMLSRSFVAEGGTIKALFFAGLPKTCDPSSRGGFPSSPACSEATRVPRKPWISSACRAASCRNRSPKAPPTTTRGWLSDVSSSEKANIKRLVQSTGAATAVSARGATVSPRESLMGPPTAFLP
jgi:hypothetical protein